jgi:adenosylcobalamin-dependent ribonucleoside-triphosphate reductase
MEYKDTSFALKDTFLQGFKGKQPVWGPLGYFVFKRTYAMRLNANKSEEFWQTLKRVTEGCFLIQKLHCKQHHLTWNERKSQQSAQEMYKRMWDMKFLPPGRGLAAMGTEFVLEKSSAPLFNCAGISTQYIKEDFSFPFTWLMTMSLMGVGVGFDTLGSEKELYLKKPRRTKDTHIIEDSREGWVEALTRVLESFTGTNSLPEVFDYSLIRPAGSLIKTFGGIAPGPEPLRKLLERVEKYSMSYANEDRVVDSTYIVDVMNFIGACVVAGGTRRTAEIAFGSPKDEAFLALKKPEFVSDQTLARWASNNSVSMQIGASYEKLAAQTIVNGEPGYLWLENAREFGRLKDPRNDHDRNVILTNPCGEIGLHHAEMCNLSESYPSNHDSLEDYLQTLKYAFLYCKTVTLLPTHSALTNQVQMKNRRIGISQSGIVENINKIGLRAHLNWCDKGYQELRKWDQVYSDWLCIRKSIKLTTVKPSGTNSLLAGKTPGIHYPHSEYYIRRIRISKNSTLVQSMIEAGYKVVPDEYERDHTMVIEFPVHEPNFVRRKADVSFWEQLELVALLQSEWADNAVSATITIKPEEGKEVATALEMFETRLKSISFLPLKEHQYTQAPYEEITAEQYIERNKGLKKPKLNISNEDEGKDIDKFCDGGGLCEI